MVETIFRSFDSNNNGRIDMHELACGMGALWRSAQTQMRVPAAVRSHEPGQVRLVWPERPRTALIVKKWRDSDVTQMARHAGAYLQQRGVVVKVEERVRDDDLPEFDAMSEEQLSGEVASEIDFVLCLGGDGTLLHLSSLLTGNGENAVPPVVSFGLGSLGFLTPFDIRDLEHCLDRLLDTDSQELFCSIRTYLSPCILRSRTTTSKTKQVRDFIANSTPQMRQRNLAQQRHPILRPKINTYVQMLIDVF